MKYQHQNDEHDGSFIQKIGCLAYLHRHRKAALIILISAILGIAAGLTLNYSLSLHNRNYIVRRKFETNQVFSYGRLLTNCLQMGSNQDNGTSSTINVTADSTKQCDLQKSMVTFFVTNVTGDQSQIVVSVDDYQEFHSNGSYILGKSIQNLTWEDFKNNDTDSARPIPHLFYLTMNVGGEFVSLAVDSKATKEQVETVKTLLHQFTPNLNKQLYNSFKNNDKNSQQSSSSYSGQSRLLQQQSNLRSSSHRMLGAEEHPQGYIQPDLSIVSDNSSQVTIQKSYDQSNFVNGSTNLVQGSGLNYKEVTNFDKANGVLLDQSFVQNYKYEAQQNDLYNMNMKVESKGNFKLFNQSFLKPDQISLLIQDKLSQYQYITSVSNDEVKTNTQTRRRVLTKEEGVAFHFDDNQYEVHEKLIEQQPRANRFNHQQFERILTQYKRKHNLIDDNSFNVNPAQDRMIHNLYNQRRGLSLAPVEDEQNVRLLQTENLISQSAYVPKRETFGQPILIFLQENPKSVFGVTMDMFLVIQMYKDYYQDLSKIDQSVTDNNLWKSFYTVEYKVQMKIRSEMYNKDMDLFTGGVKINNTLIEKLKTFEAYGDQIIDQMENLQEKVDEFLEKVQGFFYELENQQMKLFDSCYSLLVVDFCASCHLKFSIRFSIKNNIKDLIVNTRDAIKMVLFNNEKIRLNVSEASVLSLLPKDEPLKIDFSRIYSKFHDCKEFKKLGWSGWLPAIKTLYSCANGYTGEAKDLELIDVQTIKKNLDQTIKEITNLLQTSNNTIVTKFNQYLKNVDQLLRSDLMSNVVLNSSLDLYTRVDLFPQFSIKSKYVNSGIQLNGSLLILNTTADFSVDLYNIARNPNTALNLTQVRFDIYAKLFNFTTYVYYDYLECNGTGNKLTQIFNLIRGTRLLEETQYNLMGESEYQDLPVLEANNRALQIIERTLDERRNGQILDVGKELWSFIKTLQLPDVKCPSVDQNMKRIIAPFKSLQIPMKEYIINQTRTNLSSIIGKKYA